MGWWRAGPNGESLALEETGMTWGDQVADVMDDALDRIFTIFVQEVGRKPTKEELIGGLLFSYRPTIKDEDGASEDNLL